MLGLAPLAAAAPSFGYDYSNARTLLTGDPVHFGEYPAWSGSLRKEASDPVLYLNAIEADSQGLDPNLTAYIPPGRFDYIDRQTGLPKSYAFGSAISGSADWAIRELVSFDDSYAQAPAVGIYDFSLTLRGGSSPTAAEPLAIFNLRLEVAERLDVGIASSSTPIFDANIPSHVSLTVTNNMTRTLEITGAFVDPNGLQLDPTDPNSPSLDPTYTGAWENAILAGGATLTGSHTDWRTNENSASGSYTGGLGLVGGLHKGDFYYLYADPTTSVSVRTSQAVPEPAPMFALALGVAGLLRRRRR